MLHKTRYLCLNVACLLLIMGTVFYTSSATKSPAKLAVKIQQPSSLVKAGTTGSSTTHSAVGPAPSLKIDNFAYVFYATSDAYACSVLVNIYRLQDVLKAEFPVHVLVSSQVSASLIQTMENVNATVHLQEPPPLAGGSAPYYRDCLLKLLAFKMHVLSPGLKRVLVLDSDQLILKNLDHLFVGLPEVDLAAPRAYWLTKDVLSSTFMMISLSSRLWEKVQNGLQTITTDKYDMDLMNEMFGETVMMLSGEYATVNSHWEDWSLPNWYHPWKSIESAAGFLSTGSSSSTSPALFSPLPRFSHYHPLSVELYNVNEAAAIIHFFALGKPWSNSAESVARKRPDSHPVLAEQFKIWRDIAADVCQGTSKIRGRYINNIHERNEEPTFTTSEMLSWY